MIVGYTPDGWPVSDLDGAPDDDKSSAIERPKKPLEATDYGIAAGIGVAVGTLSFIMRSSLSTPVHAAASTGAGLAIGGAYLLMLMKFR